MFKNKIILYLLLILTVLNITCSAAFAQSDLSFRLSQLESQVATLRSEMSRLGYQSSQSRSQITVPNRPTAQQRQPKRVASQDPMFNRLATLAVEQKERMDKLETRLSALEARLSR